MKRKRRSPFLLFLFATFLVGVLGAAAAPDLIVHNLALNPPQVAPGGTVGVALNIANAGDAPSSPTAAEIRLSTNSTIDSSDVLLGIVQIPALAPGAGVLLNPSAALAGNTAPGNYFLGVILDPANQVAESNENNNTASQPLTITAGPNPPLQLQCSPSSITAADFSTEQSLCFVTRDCGPTGVCPVAFECRDVPFDVACQFSPNPVQINPGSNSASSTLRLKIGANAADGLPTKTFCFRVRVTDNAGQSQEQPICVRLVLVRTSSPVVLDDCKPINSAHLVQKPDGEIVASNPGTARFNITAADHDTSQELTFHSRPTACSGGSFTPGPAFCASPPGPPFFALLGSNPVKVYNGDPCRAGGATDITRQSLVRIETAQGTQTQPLRDNVTFAFQMIASAPVNFSEAGSVVAFRPRFPDIYHFNVRLSTDRAFTCPDGCAITSPVSAPFIVSTDPPVQRTLTSRAQVTLQTPQGQETVNLEGNIEVFAWTQVHGPAMDLYLQDGRDEVAFEILTADLRGTSNLLGPLIVRVRNPRQHPFRRSMGVMTEHSNSQAGRLDVRPFAPSGTVTVYADLYAEIEQGGQVIHTEGPVVLEGTVDQLPPPAGANFVTTMGFELRDEDEIRIGGATVGGCAVARFAYLGGTAAQRAAAVLALWLPPAVLAVLRRRARRKGR